MGQKYRGREEFGGDEIESELGRKCPDYRSMVRVIGRRDEADRACLKTTAVHTNGS